MLSTGDNKNWNIAYKDLVNGLTGIMNVADLVVEHKNDTFNLQGFLALPLNPATSDHKELPIFVPILNWKLKRVIIEEKADRESSLKTEAKKILGRKFSVVCKKLEAMTEYLARQPGGADLFICYAGVQLREAVAAKADWLVFNFEDLISSLD